MADVEMTDVEMADIEDQFEVPMSDTGGNGSRSYPVPSVETQSESSDSVDRMDEGSRSEDSCNLFIPGITPQIYPRH